MMVHLLLLLLLLMLSFPPLDYKHVQMGQVWLADVALLLPFPVPFLVPRLQRCQLGPKRHEHLVLLKPPLSYLAQEHQTQQGASRSTLFAKNNTLKTQPYTATVSYNYIISKPLLSPRKIPSLIVPLRLTSKTHLVRRKGNWGCHSSLGVNKMDRERCKEVC